jgi:hypothetical protein
MEPTAAVAAPPPDPRPASWPERYAYYRQRADPLADAVVEAVAHLPPGEGHRLVGRALAEGIDAVREAPAALRELFAQVEAVPAWVDRERVERGGYTFLRCRMGFVVLGCASLPLVYSLPSLNKVLIASGRLVQMAPVRLKETTRFVFETCRRQGLSRHGEGFHLTVRVRLIHAQVRRLLHEAGWDAVCWGAPVNQWHMAVTNVSFSEAVLHGLRRLGYRFRPEEAEALVHLWRYSGYLSGIDPELLPNSEAEARALREAAFALEGPPDEDARALVRGVMEAGIAYTRFGNVSIPYGISRSLIGRRLAAALGYPRTAWCWVVPAFRPMATLVEIARELNVPGVRALAAVCGTQMLRHIMSDRGLPGQMGDFDLPRELLGPARRSHGR